MVCILCHTSCELFAVTHYKSLAVQYLECSIHFSDRIRQLSMSHETVHECIENIISTETAQLKYVNCYAARRSE